MEKREYPLTCDFCGTKRQLKERKIYQLEVSEILINDTETKYPHKEGNAKYLFQICEDCIRNNAVMRYRVNS